MNKTLLTTFVVIIIVLVGAGVYMVAMEAFSPQPIPPVKTMEKKMESKVVQDSAMEEKEDSTVSNNYDEMMVELDQTIEVEANTTNEETEVDSANTVTSDSYLNIYNSNEF